MIERFRVESSKLWEIASLGQYSLHHFTNERQFLVGIRRVTQWHIDPCAPFHHAFGMAKGVKTAVTVVRPHAAIAHTAKRHMMGGKVHQRVVNAAAPEGNIIQNLVFHTGIVGK